VIDIAVMGLVLANEQNNIATQDTVVATGGAGENAFNQLKMAKTQTSPAGGAAVATNGTLTFAALTLRSATEVARSLA